MYVVVLCAVHVYTIHDCIHDVQIITRCLSLYIHWFILVRAPSAVWIVLAEVVAEVLLQEETADLAQHNRSGSVTQMWQVGDSGR